MKKVLFPFLIGMAVVFSFSACNKENKTESNPISSTAKITGRVQADLDGTNTGFEKAPAGTKVVAIINAASLIDNPVAGQTYPNIQYETTVDADGNYSISVACGNKPVSVTVYTEDFIYNKVGSGGSTTRTIYYGTTNSASVVKNTTTVIDFNY